MKINITRNGKIIGQGIMPETETKPLKHNVYNITGYITTKNGVGDFEDQTDLYRQIFQSHKTSLNSKNQIVANHSATKMLEQFEAVAGRALSEHEMLNIIAHSKNKNPRMKINKYGHCFGKRIDLVKSDAIWCKGDEQCW
tara:strand:- start:137 stop:556 length:420 start_codon:yes stop_codon:yes gene_type:complete